MEGALRAPGRAGGLAGGWSGRPWLEFGLLAALAIGVPLVWWIGWTVLVAGHGFNDFHDYWLAARLIAEGRSPYDIEALRALAKTEGFAGFVVGTGYSYPLPFALVMIPFLALPFDVAVLLFNAIGLVLFGLTVAAWIGWAHGWRPELARRRILLALAAGLYPPVYGTLANGQANLVLLPLIALGAAMAIGRAASGSGADPAFAGEPLRSGARLARFAGGVAVGLAAIVKLTPGLFLVPLVAARRFVDAAGIVAGAAGALVLATLLAPWAGEGSGGLAGLFDQDSYFTNQSINGFVSRIVDKSDRTNALFPNAFDAQTVDFVLTAAMALLTLFVVWRARRFIRTRRGLALALGFALVAGLIGAPKGTYWNHAMALVAAGLLLAVETPDLRLGRLGRTDLLLLGLWLFGTAIQTYLWMFPVYRSASPAALFTLLQSSATYGMTALWLLFARRLLWPPPLEAAPEAAIASSPGGERSATAAG